MNQQDIKNLEKELWDAADSLRTAGTEITDPLAIGGGTQSDLLLQTIADLLGVAIHRTTDAATGPAFGAARLAAAACGKATLRDLAAQPTIERSFEPMDTPQLTDSLHAGLGSCVSHFFISGSI